MTPGTVPAIPQVPVTPFVYAKSLGVNVAASSQLNVMSVGGLTNAACGAGSKLIVCVCVITLSHSSVNVQVIVCEPPHGSKLPLMTPGTVPAISQVPVTPFVYAKSLAVNVAASSQLNVMSVGGLTNAACGAGSKLSIC